MHEAMSNQGDMLRENLIQALTGVNRFWNPPDSGCIKINVQNKIGGGGSGPDCTR
jgi:hypothetical protein